MIPGRFKRPRAIKTPGLCDSHRQLCRSQEGSEGRRRGEEATDMFLSQACLRVHPTASAPPRSGVEEGGNAQE